MLTDIQHEVAVHLLANALRKRRRRTPTLGSIDATTNRSARAHPDDEYLRGMLDLLTALYGRETTDELYRQALALERAASTW
jgi:hypothetical protein